MESKKQQQTSKYKKNRNRFTDIKNKVVVTSGKKERGRGKTEVGNSVQLLSCVQLFASPWTAECQASLSITNSQSLFKLTSIESVMPSSHLILCHPLLLLPSIFSSIQVFSNESVLHIRWPKYWSFSFQHQSFQ